MRTFASLSPRARGRAYAGFAKGTYSRTTTYLDGSGVVQPISYVVLVPGVAAPYTGAPMPMTMGVAGDGRFGTGGEQLLEAFPLWAANANAADTLTELVVAPEFPTAANAVTVGVVAQAYINVFNAALAEFNGDRTKLGYVGFSGGGRDGVAVILRLRAILAYAALIEASLSEGMYDWAMMTSGTSQAQAALNFAALMGASGVNLPLWWGQTADDTTVHVQKGREVAAAYTDASIAPPWTATRSSGYIGSPGLYSFDNGNYGYREQVTGGHSPDWLLNMAAFTTWRQAQHK